MIEISGVRKRLGAREVLRGVDLTASAGSVTLLAGANGAGKTTLLRVVAGLLPPDAGRVRLNSRDLGNARLTALAQLSFLPQAPRFHPRLTSRQVARYYGRVRQRSDADVARELERWDLSAHAATITAHLSGGLRQRLALAVFALAGAPVLVLDEPGLSLDPYWRDRLVDFITAEARRGAAVLLATHLLAEWQGLVHRCVHLQEGTIVGELPTDTLRHAFAAAEAASSTSV